MSGEFWVRNIYLVVYPHYLNCVGEYREYQYSKDEGCHPQKILENIRSTYIQGDGGTCRARTTEI